MTNSKALPTEVTTVGKMGYTQLKNPQVNTKYLKPGQTATPKYEANLWFSDKTADGQKTLNLINSLDSRKISRKHAPSADMFKLRFTSNYAPIVKDSEGNILEGDEIPSFDTRYDNGQAIIEFSIKKNQDAEPTLYLKGIKILDLNRGDRPETVASVSKLDQDNTEARLNQLHSK